MTRSSTLRFRRFAMAWRLSAGGRVEVDGAFTRRPDDNFFHVEIGRVQQAARLTCGEHDDRVWLAGGAEVRAFERIDGDYDFGIFAGSCLSLPRQLFRR